MDFLELDANDFNLLVLYFFIKYIKIINFTVPINLDIKFYCLLKENKSFFLNFNFFSSFIGNLYEVTLDIIYASN